MKAEIVYGKLTKVDQEKITLEVKTRQYSDEPVEYPLDMALDEQWVIQHLGEYVEAILVDGKIRNMKLTS